MRTSEISAIVLAGKSDPTLLKKCLNSLGWCDEIVKIDTAKIKGSFSDWRNQGAKKARGSWILYVDSDEEVTPALRTEIVKRLNGQMVKYSAFAIPRRNFIFGKEFRHGGLWPDYVLRLIKKEKLVGWEGELHEQPKILGEIFHLKEPLIHNKHKSLSEMVEKTNDWSEIEARLMFDTRHPKMNFFRFATAALREFWKRMILQAAFLDGTEGIIYAIYQVFSRLISYSKLWELQLKQKNARGNI